MMTTYVLVMRDDHYFLIGPFADGKAAAEWGVTHNPEEDPRWQAIAIDHPESPPDVFQPSSLMMDQLSRLVVERPDVASSESPPSRSLIYRSASTMLREISAGETAEARRIIDGAMTCGGVSPPDDRLLRHIAFALAKAIDAAAEKESGA